MANEPPSDIELMARLGRGDLAALGTLAERYQSRILSLSYRLLGDWHRAEDVSQETFLRLRQAAGSYEPQAKFTTWLYRIVHNLSLDQRRKTGKDPVSLEAVQADAVEVTQASPLERRELAQAVQNAVGELPERQRRVIILHRYEGLSHEEISKVTGWSKSAVESLLVRAYENLRKKLQPYQDFSP
ncbi:MAG: RNA polymerase sigma factor [Planctomycetes bacterium]|jgi:RNA polymerase sigma-70 factor (ECF subfamily)|nr:RNA polymerase sigma factor [Planctomycetota bacterium]